MKNARNTLSDSAYSAWKLESRHLMERWNTVILEIYSIRWQPVADINDMIN